MSRRGGIDIDMMNPADVCILWAKDEIADLHAKISPLMLNSTETVTGGFER